MLSSRCCGSAFAPEYPNRPGMPALITDRSTINPPTPSTLSRVSGLLSRERPRIALFLILWLALALRVLNLDQTPPGLHYDEAFKAISAREVVRTGQLHIFFTGNFGEEPLHATVGAALFALLGERIWAIRLVSVLFGVLLIPALYFCAIVLVHSRRTAMVSSLVGSTLYCSLNFSRIALEPITLALMITLHLGSLWWALAPAAAARSPRARAVRFAAAGFFAGAVYYTYLASRVTPAVLGLFGLYLILWHREVVSRNMRGILVAAAVGLVVLSPLALFFIQNPVAFGARAGQVLTPEGLGQNVQATAGMFFFRGDADPRDNLPGRALLDPILALLFLVGIVVSLRRWRQPPYALLLIWFAVLTAPAILTEFAPNFRRSIGALPAVILFCAIGADAFLSLAGRVLDSTPGHAQPSPWLAPGILLLGLAASSIGSIYAYFGIWAKDPGLFYSFDAGLLQVAQNLHARPPGERLYLSPAYVDHPTVLWALDGRPFASFDGRRVTVLPDSALPATCAIITYEDQQFSPNQFLAGVQPLQTVRDFENKPYARITYIPAGAVPTFRPQQPLQVRLGDFASLTGYDLVRTGEKWNLMLYWRAEARPDRDYTVFVHLIGPVNPATGSPVWAQDDAQPGHGSYPTQSWRPGETILDRYTLILPTQAPPASYEIELGLYQLDTGARLPVRMNGDLAPDNRLVLR